MSPSNFTTLLEPSKVYHLYNRGNNREDIFRDEGNYEHFLKLYARHIMPIAETYCYCLMRNHFHLLLRIRDSRANLSDGATSLQSSANSNAPPDTLILRKTGYISVITTGKARETAAVSGWFGLSSTAMQTF